MKIFSPVTRDFALMVLPCALFLGVALLNSNLPHDRTDMALNYANPPRPTPTPAGFYVSVGRFANEKMTPQKTSLGADTFVRIEAWLHKAPQNVRWFTARRLVAIKNGRSRVLWDGQQNSSSLVLPSWGEYNQEMRGSTLLFKLRNVPVDAGELVFAWDALAQPVNHKIQMGNEKFVDAETLKRQAKAGGVRLSRRLILRHDGQKISLPNFPDTKPLKVRKGNIFLMAKPDESGSDVQIELHLDYKGKQREPEITTASVALADSNGRAVDIVSYQGGAVREGDHWIYRAATKRSNLRGAKRFRIFIVATDGHTKLQNLSATATLQTDVGN